MSATMIATLKEMGIETKPITTKSHNAKYFMPVHQNKMVDFDTKFKVEEKVTLNNRSARVMVYFNEK